MRQDTVFRPSGRGRVVVMNAPPSIPGLFAGLISLSMVRPITLAPDTVLFFSNRDLIPGKT